MPLPPLSPRAHDAVPTRGSTVGGVCVVRVTAHRRSLKHAGERTGECFLCLESFALWHALDASSPVVVTLARRCDSIVITQGYSANLSIDLTVPPVVHADWPSESITGSRAFGPVLAFVHFARNLCADDVDFFLWLPVCGSDGDPISLALDKPGRPSTCQWSFAMMVLDGG